MMPPTQAGIDSRPTHQGAGQSTAPQHQATGTQAGQEAGHTARPGSLTHPAATRTARTAQGGHGTKASSKPASDERCDSMHD